MNLILLRHGESEWNRDNRFTGWTDVDLSEQGIEEAHRAADLLKEAGLTFDVAYTSVLKRAIRTLWIVLDDLDMLWLPVYRSWRLNERHYGALQGLNKREMADEFGEEKIMLWRRSYAVQPPALAQDDSRHPRFDARYAQLRPEDVPAAESLQDTLNRVLPYWHETIFPTLARGQIALVAAHGNSLRALVKYLDGIPNEDIPGLNIPTGVPLIYELDPEVKVQSSYYLEG